jgi:hypothetical protein
LNVHIFWAPVLASPFVAESDADLGARAARMVWDDQPGVDDLIDPRTPKFANAVSRDWPVLWHHRPVP